MIDTKRDFEDVCKLTRAEMVRFDKEKVDDFKSAIENHVEGMLLRQREVSQPLESTNTIEAGTNVSHLFAFLLLGRRYVATLHGVFDSSIV